MSVVLFFSEQRWKHRLTEDKQQFYDRRMIWRKTGFSLKLTEISDSDV